MRLGLVSSRLLVACFLPVLAVLVCAVPAPPARAADKYAAAMREGFAAETLNDELPRYDLDIDVDPWHGDSAERCLRYVNTTAAELNDLVLRLYPNFLPIYSVTAAMYRCRSRISQSRACPQTERSKRSARHCACR